MRSNYDKNPYVPITSDKSVCHAGWQSIIHQLRDATRQDRARIVIECYPGVFEEEIAQSLKSYWPAVQVFRTSACLKLPSEIESMLSPYLPDDPVFGRLCGLDLIDFFDAERLIALLKSAWEHPASVILGTGAALAAPESGLLVYADMARWEIQQRQRRGEIGNLGADNAPARPGDKYRRAFFVDWRVADECKKGLLRKLDFLLDTNVRGQPLMISGHVFRSALENVARRPFRLRPFFDPGPWGGQWMREVCDLPADQPNYAWCFDCVPEENSLLLGFGTHRVEIPASDLVFGNPRELLGEAVHARFGREFPIRFDFLDTMDGGNLSLQVHPLTEYIQQHFGMHYTQDESYYLLDAGADANVYLGLKSGVDAAAMAQDLDRAQRGGEFPTDKYVNRWSAKKHDHFLIPAGTLHCSGANSMVLEISATPYIFTFKLWDWGRLGLDGRPRPIHLQHGIRNIQWDRTTEWVDRELINQVKLIAAGHGWHEERTGLHEREFIETRRHWFTEKVEHQTGGGVNVLNLVEGSEVVVESPGGNFDPLTIHYAETFVVPAAVGAYTIRPAYKTTEPFATIKAFVRTNP
jgi:mannose-6-phosphate isomerase class I